MDLKQATPALAAFVIGSLFGFFILSSLVFSQAVPLTGNAMPLPTMIPVLVGAQNLACQGLYADCVDLAQSDFLDCLDDFSGGGLTPDEVQTCDERRNGDVFSCTGDLYDCLP